MEHLKISNTPLTELLINRHVVKAFTKELVGRGMDVAFAEGATGGSLIDSLTIPGSTRVIHVGGIFYSRESKIRLGVTEKTIKNCGEYSPEVAMEMATAMMEKSGAALTVATVGQLDSDNGFGHLSIAYIQPGRKPWVKTILIPSEVRDRRLAKSEITQSVFSHGLHYLRGDRMAFRNDTNGFKHTENMSMNGQLRVVDSLAGEVISAVQKRGMKIATIESCTAGAIANALTNTPGASKVFDMGWLAYDENVKAKLGVPLLTMVNGNVYSLKVAQSMAEAILKSSSANIAIATTGTMETVDTRPYHNDTLPGTIYVAVLVRGQQPQLRKISVSCPLGKAREEVKAEAVGEILTLTYEIVERLPQVERQKNLHHFK